jgi:hypothetical protein
MTAKKPKLTVVGTAATGLQPPRKLGQHGTSLWREIHAEYSVTDRGGAELLAQACAAIDRAEALAACVAHAGPVIRSKSGVRVHPAVREELAARAFVVRTLEKLGVTREAVQAPGRPATGFGWEGEDADEQTET